MIAQDLMLAIGAIDKLVSLFPSYSQKKRDKFYKIKRELFHEIAKPYPEIDDGRILSLSFELREWGQVFLAEISTESLPAGK